MQAQSDMVILEAASRPVPLEHPGIRATLRALVGRLGTPDLAASQGMGLLPDPLALHGLDPDWASASTPAPEDEASLRSRAAKIARERRRANAHAAYDSVVGTHAAALDAALAVLEAELAILQTRCAAQCEALKRLQLYGRDTATRDLAAKGLTCDPEVLADHGQADRGRRPAGAPYHA